MGVGSTVPRAGRRLASWRAAARLQLAPRPLHLLNPYSEGGFPALYGCCAFLILNLFFDSKAVHGYDSAFSNTLWCRALDTVQCCCC